ncbi:MAG: ECF transporter S component [Candidatus Cloacimonetes bacterium]|nr:ECF transporter S component [Candidatus Cloacimonadota bacterium]
MRLLAGFRALDLLHIAVFAALGLAVKQLVNPLALAISRPLLIPGGSLAGGFYMMWIALAMAVVRRPGAGVLVGLVQGIVVLVLGFFGSHGAFSLISYTLPGVAAELAGLFFRRKHTTAALVWICTLANLAGSGAVTVVLMRLPLVPMLIALTAAAISGIVGGLLARAVWVKLAATKIIKHIEVT